MEVDAVVLNGELTLEQASPQLALLEVDEVSANPNPPALSNSDRWFDLLADKMAERRARVNDALYQMGHILIDAKKSLRGVWLKFLNDPRVGLHEREAEKMMRISRQVDGPDLGKVWD
jgi:hypothetical protein